MQTLSPPRINKATKLKARIQRGGKAGSVPSHKPNTISRCGKLPVSNKRTIQQQVVLFTGDRIELPLHALEELGGFLDRPRQLLLVLHQHVAVSLLQQQAGAVDYLRATNLDKIKVSHTTNELNRSAKARRTMNWSSSGSARAGSCRRRLGPGCASSFAAMAESLSDTSGGAPTYDRRNNDRCI